MSEWSKDITIKGVDFRIKKANDKKHKYIVWTVSKTDIPGKVLLTHPVKFGAYGMEQYHDRFGVYSDLDHKDTKRLKAFQNRFRKLYEKNKDNPGSGIYWSWNFLW